MRSDLRAELRHVFWIGGASGAGKSTVARRLAAEHGLQLYVTDDVMSDHARRLPTGSAPYLSAFAAMDLDERWLNRSPQTMFDTFHWYVGEGFDLVVEDLRRLPSQPGVIAEGFRLLPHLVKPLLTGWGRATWLLPTPAFRRSAFESRGALWEIAGKTSDPPRALRLLLEREEMFTERLRGEVADLDLLSVNVDETLTEETLTRRVGQQFGLPPCTS